MPIKPIRFSTWTLRHKKKKSQVVVVEKIIVTGLEKDISSIKNNSLYLGRVYRELFGKGKWQKARDEDMYDVIDIKLDDKIIGQGGFSSNKTEEQVREQEIRLEWD
jgi:hypothetical protein